MSGPKIHFDHLEGGDEVDPTMARKIYVCNFNFNFDDIVHSTMSAQALRHIRSSVPRNVANTIACSIMHSRIDYRNSLLLGVLGKNVDKLQRVQN